MNKIRVPYELPEGWAWTTLGEIVEPSKEKVNPSDIEDVPYIGLEHIEKDTGQLLGCGSSSEIRSTKSKFLSGDLLYGKLRPYLNKVCVPGFGGICSTDILVYPKTLYIKNEYLLYRFLFEDFVRYTSQNVSGVQHPRVNIQTLSRFEIALPPLSEQCRIVVKIEELFTQLNAGVIALEKAQAQLTRYRQSVLKAAVEGKLTREWRETHPDVEPASVLLERILRERRATWEEEELAKLISRGQRPKNDRWKQKYKEPQEPETKGVPKLPDGWTWATAEQCTTTISDGEHITPERSDSGVLLLSARNIQNGYLSLENVDFVPDNVYEILTRRLTIEPGDILMSCSGSVGRSCVVPNNLKFALVRSVAVLKPVLEMGVFLSFAIRSPLLQRQINEKKTQTAQSNIFQGKIKTLLFPIPPISEQHEIVSEIEHCLSVADQIEVALETNLKRAARLRQSILKKAFRGELMPQNPNDEPASELIRRIKGERDKNKQKELPIKREKKGDVSMDKTRRSLYDVLVEAKIRLTPEELFSRSGFIIETIDEFYQELRSEVDTPNPRIDQIRPNNKDAYLKVSGNEDTQP